MNSYFDCTNCSVYFVAPLLHTKPLRDGGHVPVQVRAIAPRHFVLDPYPFAETC